MWRRFGGKLWRWLRRGPRLYGPALWRFLTRPGRWRHRRRLAGGGDFRQRLHLFLSAERNFQHAALLFGRSAQSMPEAVVLVVLVVGLEPRSNGIQKA